MDKILEKMEAAAEAEYEKILAKWGVFHSAMKDMAFCWKKWKKHRKKWKVCERT